MVALQIAECVGENNFPNHPTFDKVVTKALWLTFLEHPVVPSLRACVCITHDRRSRNLYH